jgi:hypothetical protein
MARIQPAIKKDNSDRKWSDLFSRLANAEDGTPRFSIRGGEKYLFYEYDGYSGGHAILDKIIGILEPAGIDSSTTGSDSAFNVSSYETDYDFLDGGLRINSGNAFFDSPKHGAYVFGFRALRWIIDKLHLPQPRRFKRERWKQTTFQEDQWNVEPEGMTRVASGELYFQIDWEPGFEVLGYVQGILANLGKLGKEESIDWGAIIGENHYFDGIKSADFPPLNDEKDFEHVFDKFLAVFLEPAGQMHSGLFDRLYLYVETDERDIVVQEFVRFLEHLKGLRVLQDAGIV